jgi:hypothetical protein
VAFSQSTFTASESDGIILVCAELLTGDLETEISLLVDVLDLESNTGTLFTHLQLITRLSLVVWLSWESDLRYRNLDG